ncbi:dTDP-4-dehydrorhamnose 3,5-epimerase [Thiomicrorhabdus cannonii]|uniref:dTDP-4-dehydrorhamnose 3,5-epimerase n=1 Tax=Thiomicrorhabdus cannonii TaxID=2748011 RepID=UPI0015BCFF9F
MEFIRQAIPEVVLIKPQVLGDARGYFVETFRQDRLAEAIGYQVNFCQDNESKSSYGVLRGLHYQLPPYAQNKLVRVVAGKVLDIAVDIRHGSPTFGQHVSTELSGENKQQLFVPEGFAHGFVVLSETAIVAYKVDHYYAPEHERGLAYDDPALQIDWRLPANALILSAKDRHQPGLLSLPKAFEYGAKSHA